jgi:hypothetical protein
MACRSTNTIAMGNWTREGFVGQMFKTFAKFIAPSNMPAPVLWGDDTVVRPRLGHGVSDLNYPFPPAGPTNRAFAARKLREELEDLWSTHNRGGDELTGVSSEYLEVIAVRA